MELEGLLGTLVRDRGSDLILKTGGFPAMRVRGLIRYIADERVERAFAHSLLERFLDTNARAAFQAHGAADLAFDAPEIGRFRVNCFRQNGELSYVFRHVCREIPSFKDLNLPVDPLQKLASLQRGMILATGVAGSGKSTTLAAILEFINRTMNRHVVTIEDPIEFLFEDRLSVINQREIGVDCPDFTTALKYCVRQAPDVILIGEMRDRDTIEAAIHAAETGHLVLSTLHTVNAVQTVERIILYFPPHQHPLIRQQLALNLAGVISQRLLRVKDGHALMPAVELLLATPTIRDILSEGRTLDLPRALAEGGYWGTSTFNQSLRRLAEAGNVTLEDALAASDNPDELKMQLRGITSGMQERRYAGRPA